MADQSNMDSLQELSGMAKISSSSDTSFIPTKQLISPGYNMNNNINDKVFEATIENAKVGGGAMDASAVNQDRVPEVPLIPDGTSTCCDENNKHHDDYQLQVDNLFDVNYNISAHLEQLYSDISSAESNDESVYDSDDDCTRDDELADIGSKKNNTENDNVLESMKGFISTEENSGPNINNALAAYMYQGLRTRPNLPKNTTNLLM
ncbi:unnamed protein product [Mytilus coruscus]|uniref:Uncharacterized protein n=1 Tax=Mytilus coruscus TaxID=42192 RepID=A0A6J8CJ18_MYTCO|nr:unnamed protein product [Mytilus coruscus]